MKKKIVVFTGAGVSEESGIPTFRTGKNGLWLNHKIDDVATISAWHKDKQKVLDFYNERRRQLENVKPNLAHKLIAELENNFDVTVITQNVDNLHERGGSSNVIHIHGELTKSQSSSDEDLIYDCGYNDIKLGDKCENGSQLRPHVVWFGEYPCNIEESYKTIEKCDYLIIIGTSLFIHYCFQMLTYIKLSCEVFFIDPNPVKSLSKIGMEITYINKKASEGIKEVFELLN